MARGGGGTTTARLGIRARAPAAVRPRRVGARCNEPFLRKCHGTLATLQSTRAASRQPSQRATQRMPCVRYTSEVDSCARVTDLLRRNCGVLHRQPIAHLRARPAPTHRARLRTRLLLGAQYKHTSPRPAPLPHTQGRRRKVNVPTWQRFQEQAARVARLPEVGQREAVAQHGGAASTRGCSARLQGTLSTPAERLRHGRYMFTGTKRRSEGGSADSGKGRGDVIYNCITVSRRIVVREY